MSASLGRSPTFVVDTVQQRVNLDEFKRNDQHLSEHYRKNKPLCFNARAFQKTHPKKAAEGHTDADVTLVSPIMIGVADGVSQIEDFGIDPSELPRELMDSCADLGEEQLLPTNNGKNIASNGYEGPVGLMREAYERTDALGSTTACLAILDNSTQIHGKLHPMLAVLTIGDCELLMLRRLEGRKSPLDAIFHTEMQRIGGNAQQPIQLSRLDDRVDPHFDESSAIEVIERGSAAHFVSTYEGDVFVIGSDGVFDNLYLDEIVRIVNDVMPPNCDLEFCPRRPEVFAEASRRIVQACHAKTSRGPTGFLYDSPIGIGGKVDDTSVVVGEAVEWRQAFADSWVSNRRRQRHQRATSLLDHDLIGVGDLLQACCSSNNPGPDDFFRSAAKPKGAAPHSKLREDSEQDDPFEQCSIS